MMTQFLTVNPTVFPGGRKGTEPIPNRWLGGVSDPGYFKGNSGGNRAGMNCPTRSAPSRVGQLC
jgi:hypothetical protein